MPGPKTEKAEVIEVGKPSVKYITGKPDVETKEIQRAEQKKVDDAEVDKRKAEAEKENAANAKKNAEARRSLADLEVKAKSNGSKK